MPISAKPYRRKTFATVMGKRMAYVEHGSSDTIVFQHGNPTSSYLWRNVMPHCVGLGRLIACDLIGMGDPSSSIVGPRLYEQFLFPYQKKIVDGVHALGAKARVHICGNTRRSLDLLGQLGADILDVDSMVPVADAREKTRPAQVLLGGIDPVRTLSMGSPASVAESIRECYRVAGPRYIAGAGCEVPPEVPDANLTALAQSLIMVGTA